MKRLLILTGVLLLCLQANAQPYLQSCAVDVSQDFTDFSNTYFFADSLASFNPATASGSIRWKRHSLFGRQAFNTTKVFPLPLQMLDFPPDQYENNPQLRFSIDFISPVTVRLRVYTSPVNLPEEESLMLVGTPPRDESWTYTRGNGTHTYTGREGSIVIREYPFTIMLCDERGREMTRTRHWADNDSTQIKVLPFQFIKRASDNIRSINPVFSLRPNERIVGCGESPTALNKVGQKVHLFVTDPQSPEGDQMYKPIPFFISNRGYGMFMHTSAPVTCDFGATHAGSAKLFMADETLDLFLFWGKPAAIIDQYTNLTGKATMPPLWSFGTWMSRITYFSQEEGYEVAGKLRKNKIPADVIHFDTGWFQTDWQCDYVFAPDRFPDAQKMINDLLADGFHISLWQLPYFTPKNKYFPELIEKGLYVKNQKGGLPYEDVVLDFTNPETVAWYQEKLEGLLSMGVGAIKVDFGEGAPLNGYYANGKGGLYEHNLYPLRYNKAVADITRKTKNETIMWARSAWAGSQRYPLHWGGDAANTDIGMLTTLRSGLSLGLCGFSFWSHDIGGFVQSCPEELYSRWLPFGFLTSHTRIHGAPPTEPWFYSNEFMDGFRRSAEMKYRLMPYILDQSRECTQTGLPMLRALLIAYPDDPVVWQIEDQYLFGSDMMVAPLFESGSERLVYLPVDRWVDYQSGKTYEPGWHRIAAGQIPAVILVKKGAVIPQVPVAQSTDKIEWEKVKKIKY
ncbi:MAG TPA: alpha-xylosidase [Bacteroidales bacterium]|nr:MAG: Alpha-xylosidase [Bacteroidetes bacterium ADurb.Bin139]HOG25196.1 alpha-xylosidase [Bacteroidales bacterium]HOR11024.1 alpha-xylosidase [Bacteroidales bacterium]HOZ19494.1 alpha-xylosidase [Bacteroidales bacterium]HPB77220.1 alpha-xylosidase [Bacteroidales bacterium]